MPASTNFPNRPFRLEDRSSVVGQSGNSSLVRSELWIIKNSASPTYSFNPSSWSEYVEGILVGSDGSFTYDFRNTDSMLLHRSDNWFAHDADGNLLVNIDSYADVNLLGHAEIHYSFWAPRIPKPPRAPGTPTFSNITATNIRVTLPDVDNMGATVTAWEFQNASNAAFTSEVASRTWAGRILDINGLVSGKQYWFRGRAQNSQGWSGWSPIAGPVSTLATLYYSDGVQWRPGQLMVSNGTSWRSPEVRYSNGSVWNFPLSL